MASTSPDALWSPDAGDVYALTTDLAIGMDSVQSALNRRANYSIGTSSERVDALEDFSEGAMWYDINTSSEWRKIGGVWVDQNPDTGWITLPLLSGFSGGTVLSYRKKKDEVEFRGNITRTAGAFPNAYTQVATLPEGFRPSTYGRWPTAGYASATGVTHLIDVNTDGTMRVGPMGPGSSDVVYIAPVRYSIN